jgi:hypothetical protein
MTLFWDRQNKPIEDTIEWAKKFEADEYRIVAVDVDDADNMTKMVSTIWNGLDRGLSLDATDETALIFETAYLEHGEVIQFWLDNSEDQALHRHRMVCLSMLSKEPDAEGSIRAQILRRSKGQQ